MLQKSQYTNSAEANRVKLKVTVDNFYYETHWEASQLQPFAQAGILFCL